uniref:Uncharacterized protein n=1 Tax=Arundo donax TaxID=35708 RepID=A0A0A9A4X7_ARUDO
MPSSCITFTVAFGFAVVYPDLRKMLTHALLQIIVRTLNRNLIV